MAEPTRDQIAQDYAKALAIIDGLRVSHAELLAALRALTGGLWIEAIADENDAIRRLLVAGRAAIAKAEGRS